MAIPGDVNGDGIVNIFDLATVGLAFGSRSGDPNWNPDADVFEDGVINIFDLATVGINFGKGIWDFPPAPPEWVLPDPPEFTGIWICENVPPPYRCDSLGTVVMGTTYHAAFLVCNVIHDAAWYFKVRMIAYDGQGGHSFTTDWYESSGTGGTSCLYWYFSFWYGTGNPTGSNAYIKYEAYDFITGLSGSGTSDKFNLV